MRARARPVILRIAGVESRWSPVEGMWRRNAQKRRKARMRDASGPEK